METFIYTAGLALFVIFFICLFIIVGKLSDIVRRLEETNRLLQNIDLQILDARSVPQRQSTP